MAGNEFYCSVCQLHLNGPKPLEQHLQSAKHKKREENARYIQLGMASEKHICRVCNVSCDTYLALETHKMTPGHKVKEKENGEMLFGRPGVVNISSLSDMTTGTAHTIPQPKPMPPVVPPNITVASGSTEIPEEEYIMTGSSGFCHLCRTALSSPQMAEQHLSGKKHLNAKQRWQIERDLELRNSTTSAEIESSHTSNLVGTLSRGNLTTTSTYLPSSSSRSELTTDRSDMGKQTTEKSYNFDGKTGECHACSLNFASLELLVKHLTTDDHNKKDVIFKQSMMCKQFHKSLTFDLDSDEEMPEQKLLPVQRDAANAPLQSTFSSALKSTKGYMPDKEENYQSPGRDTSIGLQTTTGYSTVGSPSGQLSAAPIAVGSSGQPRPITKTVSEGIPLPYPVKVPPFGIVGDNTVWHRCPVCFKNVNSADQLNTHLASHSKSERLATVPGVPSSARTGSSDGCGTGMPRPIVGTGASVLRSSQPAHTSPSSHISHLDEGMPRSSGSPSTDYGRSTVIGAERVGFLSPSQPKSDSVVKDLETAMNAFQISERLESLQYKYVQPPHQPLVGKPSSVKEKMAPITMLGMTPKSIPQFFAEFSGPCGHDQCVYHCHICDICLQGDHPALTHQIGKKHKDKYLKSNPAPHRQLPPVEKFVSLEECMNISEHLTEYKPRNYQKELYAKAMHNDTVVFLPTGTGKTLVAAMVISHMLHLNPRRTVVFLVDKILLVIQQSKVLKDQLKEAMFQRYNEETGETTFRPIQIAALCGDRQVTNDMLLWQQDVIVATAAYFENVLQRGLIRWSDLALVVFDEAHHCHKNHPFHQLITRHHRTILEPSMQPKIMGLTASPAGLDTLQKTQQMLHELMLGLGGVFLAMVEENTEELALYQSNTELKIEFIDHSQEEKMIQREMQKYLVGAYDKIKTISNINDLVDPETKETFEKAQDALSRGEVELSLINSDRVEEFLNHLRLAEMRPDAMRVKLDILRMHTQVVCMAFLNVEDMGYPSAISELSCLVEDDYQGNFKNAAKAEMVINSQLQSMVISGLRDKNKLGMKANEIDLNPEMMPVLLVLAREIMAVISNPQSDNPMVLVLVRMRQQASKVAAILKEMPQIKTANVGVTHVVGHGSGGARQDPYASGMPINKQEKVLHKVKNHEFQVLVATSVAEEGVDIPDCELVVQLDPPKEVRALVQIRGRARKKGSRFLALTRDISQGDTLRNLMAGERYMVEAARSIVQQQRLYTTCSTPLFS